MFTRSHACSFIIILVVGFFLPQKIFARNPPPENPLLFCLQVNQARADIDLETCLRSSRVVSHEKSGETVLYTIEAELYKYNSDTYTCHARDWRDDVHGFVLDSCEQNPQ